MTSVNLARTLSKTTRCALLLVSLLTTVAVWPTTVVTIELKIWADNELVAAPFIKTLSNEYATLSIERRYDARVRVSNRDGRCFIDGSVRLTDSAAIETVTFAQTCVKNKWIELVVPARDTEQRAIRVAGQIR